MIYCTIFKEDSFIPTYMMTFLINMLGSRVLWNNDFLGNAEDYVENWTGYSLFCSLRLSSQIAQLGLRSVALF